jgi:hypothetical protein
MATKTAKPAPDVATPPVPEPAPAPSPNPAPPKAPQPKAARALSPKEEVAFLRKRIAADEARIHQLERPFVEFPKMVNGRVFHSRAQQDAAGEAFVDPPKKG